MIYLASPYTHPTDNSVMEDRFNRACRVAGRIMAAGEVVFSPIAHTHPIAVRCEMPRGWDFWERFDREFIAAADRVVVVMMDGWDTSRGVAAEIAIATEMGKPVEFIAESDFA